MVKAYLRYEFAKSFGVITSNSNILFSADGKSIVSSALENVALWNVKQGSLAHMLSPSITSSSNSSTSSPEVTQVALSPSGTQLAAGYADGSVRLWDLPSSTCQVTLQGHKSAVSSLRYSPRGDLLASGGRDTDVIVWDVVGEAGLYRLRGHTDQVTDLAFLSVCAKLVSSSKDGSLRVWDLTAQRCCQTVTGFKGEVWSLDVNPEQTRVVAGSVVSDLKVFSVQQGADHSSSSSGHEVLHAMGGVRRTAQERVALVRFDAGGGLLGVLSVGKSLELFKVRSLEETKKKLKRRKKRKAEKQAAKASKSARTTATGGAAGAAADDQHDHEAASDDDDGEPPAAGDDDDAAAAAVAASDEIGSMLLITAKHKVRSFAFAPHAAAAAGGGGVTKKGSLGQVALSLANNTLEVVDFTAEGWEQRQQISQPGHRSDIRCVALSDDDQLLLTASNAGPKVWNPETGACVASMEGGYGLCAVFAPGNKHAVIGTKEGTLELYDLGACSRIHVESAHSGPVWSLALLPDKSGFVSGSADKTIKFWTWTVVTAPAEGGAVGEGEGHDSSKKKKKGKKGEEEEGEKQQQPGKVRRQLGVMCMRQLEMSDDVLCVRVSPDGRLLAASLLDATIKVFYVDSLKFFLSLYGHKLPVLTMDISSDSTLLVSGSADKNIKVWGLDFGDCHRSLFAHQDTVMSVSFVRDTHYVFSAGKDKMLKYWDMDRFEMLLELPGHHGEVWGLAVSTYGDFVMTGSHDRSIRRWGRTSEPFFVEEEKEKRLESLFEADLEKQQQQEGREGEQVDGPATAPAGRRTLETVSATDAIVDALEMAAHEEEKQEEYQRAVAAAEAAAAAAPARGGLQGGVKRPQKPLANPLLLGLGPSGYVLQCLGGVRAGELEQALLLLPFTDAVRLMRYLAGWLEEEAQVELCCRAASLLLRLHHSQLAATPSARQTLLDLHKHLRRAMQGLKDTLGFNIAAVRHLLRSAKDASGVDEGQLVIEARRKLLGAAAS